MPSLNFWPGFRTFKIKMTDHTHRKNRQCWLFPFITLSKDKKTECRFKRKISVAESLRKWPCFDKSCGSKPCVCDGGARYLGDEVGGGWGAAVHDYVYYLPLTFILFYVSFICIRGFLCAATLLLNRVLTGCRVENNLTWTIILSRVIHGMLCNVKTPLRCRKWFCQFFFALISALLLSAHPVQRWRENLFLRKKRNKNSNPLLYQVEVSPVIFVCFFLTVWF